jgi:membrane protease YdiL (CAAX protease family)
MESKPTSVRAHDAHLLAATRRRRAALALLCLVPAPSLGVASEMLWFPGALGLSILLLTKFWILLLPLAWTLRVDRQALRWPALNSRGLLLGVGTGLVGATAVVLGYQFVLAERIDPELLREMARANHLLSPSNYLWVALYICALNSLLEEYVWRWFVFSRFEQLLGRRLAVVFAALAFTLHHTLILASQFGLELTVIGSIAVFVAGLTWSWIYARSASIWSAWASHALVDIAVFWAGWQILFVQ